MEEKDGLGGEGGGGSADGEAKSMYDDACTKAQRLAMRDNASGTEAMSDARERSEGKGMK